MPGEKMAAIDIDGTLVDEDEHFFPGVVDAIKEARAAGVRIVLASGRIYEGTRAVSESLGLEDPVVALDGSVVADVSGRVLRSVVMPQASVRRVYDFCERHGVSVRAQSPGTSFILVKDRNNPDVMLVQERMRRWPPRRLEVVTDYAGMPVDGVNKITVMFHDEKTVAGLRSQLRSIVPDVNATLSFRTWLGITAPEASKLSGVRFLADMFGIDRQNIAAVGDHENDLDLIRWAGFGVFTESAPISLKGQARLQAPSGESTVAWVLRKLIEA